MLPINIKTSTTPEPGESPILPPRPQSRISAETVVMDLNTLFKFVKPYDGCREKLNSFIVNCDNALSLATESQKQILFKYIISQLEGKAELACSIKDFTCWLQLKDFLKEQFFERKHYSHLLAEIQESRQGPLENVSQFALKMETCLSQIMTEVSLSGPVQTELTGRIAAMEDLVLHHFITGLNPRISMIVRCKSPKTLNEAINIAVSEERIQQAVYRRAQQTENKNKPRPSFTKPSFTQRPTTNAQGNNLPSNPQITCRYCKNAGHVIENCRKREYNNSRFRNPQPQPFNRNSQPQPFNRNLNSFSKPGPSRINYTQEENIESRDEVDFTPENEFYPNHLND